MSLGQSDGLRKKFILYIKMLALYTLPCYNINAGTTIPKIMKLGIVERESARKGVFLSYKGNGGEPNARG